MGMRVICSAGYSPENTVLIPQELLQQFVYEVDNILFCGALCPAGGTIIPQVSSDYTVQCTAWYVYYIW